MRFLLKFLKTVKSKKSSKDERERKVLIGLIDYYLKTGKPVGSNTLKETGFEELSSATIRNYFAHMEEQGFLDQQHVSGGRIPTPAAFRFYANEFIDSSEISTSDEKLLGLIRNSETREIATYLQQSAETLSSLTNCAVFLSAPRFDHDYIVDLKLVMLDPHRLLCILITDFGVIQTELLHTEIKLTLFSVKRMESYSHWRLTGHDKPDNLEAEEKKLAQELHNELMVRYIVGYSNFIDEEVYRTGFSKLLTYPDFKDTTVLATSLSLFENSHSMRLLLKECRAANRLKYWIGDDLAPYTASIPNCAVLAIPYHINKQPVGAIGLLGPIRMPFRERFGLLRAFGESISESMTRNLYKFKIHFRQPQPGTSYLSKEEHFLLGQSRLMLLEDQTRSHENNEPKS
jgi:heat-inducible transcriptional repressor